MVETILSYAFFGGIVIMLIGVFVAVKVLAGYDDVNTLKGALGIVLIGSATVIVSFFTHLFIAL